MRILIVEFTIHVNDGVFFTSHKIEGLVRNYDIHIVDVSKNISQLDITVALKIPDDTTNANITHNTKFITTKNEMLFPSVIFKKSNYVTGIFIYSKVTIRTINNLHIEGDLTSKIIIKY